MPERHVQNADEYMALAFMKAISDTNIGLGNKRVKEAAERRWNKEQESIKIKRRSIQKNRIFKNERYVL